MANSEKKPGPNIWISMTPIVIGALLLSFGLYTAITTSFDILMVESFSTPGSQTRELGAGEYEIYENVGEIAFFDFDDETLFETATAGIDQVRVSNLDTGGQLSLYNVFEPNLDRNSTIYAPVAGFTVETNGSYEISVDTEFPTTAIVGRALVPALESSVPYFVAAGVGAFLLLIGIILLIVGLVRRGRAKKSLNPVGTGPYAAPAFQSPYAAAAPPMPGGAAPAAPYDAPPSSAPPQAAPTHAPSPHAPPSQAAPSYSAPSHTSAPPAPSPQAPAQPKPSVDPNTPDTSTPWD